MIAAIISITTTIIISILSLRNYENVLKRKVTKFDDIIIDDVISL